MLSIVGKGSLVEWPVFKALLGIYALCFEALTGIRDGVAAAKANGRACVGSGQGQTRLRKLLGTIRQLLAQPSQSSPLGQTKKARVAIPSDIMPSIKLIQKANFKKNSLANIAPTMILAMSISVLASSFLLFSVKISAFTLIAIFIVLCGFHIVNRYLNPDAKTAGSAENPVSRQGAGSVSGNSAGSGKGTGGSSSANTVRRQERVKPSSSKYILPCKFIPAAGFSVEIQGPRSPPEREAGNPTLVTSHPSTTLRTGKSQVTSKDNKDSSAGKLYSYHVFSTSALIITVGLFTAQPAILISGLALPILYLVFRVATAGAVAAARGKEISAGPVVLDLPPLIRFAFAKANQNGGGSLEQYSQDTADGAGASATTGLEAEEAGEKGSAAGESAPLGGLGKTTDYLRVVSRWVSRLPKSDLITSTIVFSLVLTSDRSSPNILNWLLRSSISTATSLAVIVVLALVFFFMAVILTQGYKFVKGNLERSFVAAGDEKPPIPPGLTPSAVSGATISATDSGGEERRVTCVSNLRSLTWSILWNSPRTLPSSLPRERATGTSGSSSSTAQPETSIAATARLTRGPKSTEETGTALSRALLRPATAGACPATPLMVRRSLPRAQPRGSPQVAPTTTTRAAAPAPALTAELRGLPPQICCANLSAGAVPTPAARPSPLQAGV